MYKYNSSNSIAHRKPVYIYNNDPRAKNDQELQKYISRAGAKVIVENIPPIQVQEGSSEEYKEPIEYSTLFNYQYFYGTAFNFKGPIKVIIYNNNVPFQTDTGSQSYQTVTLGLGLGNGEQVGVLVGKPNIEIGSYYFDNIGGTWTSKYLPELPERDYSGLNLYPKNDDWAQPYTLPFEINIGNYTGNQISILNNGGITIGQSFYSYTWTPSPLSTFAYPMVWGLWYDIDTRGTGDVYYGVKTDLGSGKQYFQLSFVDVGYFASKTTNLTSFDIIIYEV